MQRSGIPFGPLLGVLILAACAGVSADFVKAGATREEVRADNAACRAEADAQVGREADISRDIRVGSSRGSEDSQVLVQQTRDARIEARYERIFAACMAVRGYTRR